jgi:hypothetical protein
MVASGPLQVHQVVPERRRLFLVHDAFEKADEDRRELVALCCFHCAHCVKMTRGKRTRLAARSPSDGITSVSVTDSSIAAVAAQFVEDRPAGRARRAPADSASDLRALPAAALDVLAQRVSACANSVVVQLRFAFVAAGIEAARWTIAENQGQTLLTFPTCRKSVAENR